MNLNKITYGDLNSRQKEIYNFQKIAAVLADYGFNCIKLADDWQGADFLAYHKDGCDTLKIQLKARITISGSYINKELYIAFLANGHWYLIEHDKLVELVSKNTNWLSTSSWIDGKKYSSINPSKKLIDSLAPYQIS